MNWKKIIQDIVDSGMSEKDIAEIAHTTQPTINRIKSGFVSEPRYEVGAILVKLHSERFKKAA